MTFTAADQQPQTIAVQKRPLLDLGSVESAAAVGNTLEITLTPAGRLRFAQAATPRMAIVLEGKVREILNQSEFKGTVIKVHGLSPVEAAAFAAKINAATNK
jgi:hypothetical protein